MFVCKISGYKQCLCKKKHFINNQLRHPQVLNKNFMYLRYENFEIFM